MKIQDIITEAFDAPYPMTWEHGDESHDALVRLPDGSNLSIMFSMDYGAYGDEEWTVEFWRSNSQDVTGEGDQQRIFATVLTAIQQFINDNNPERIRFSANKDVEPGQKSMSRTNLYNTLVKRYANKWGYSVDIDDHAGSTVYNLHTFESKQGVTEVQDQVNSLPSVNLAKQNIHRILVAAQRIYDEWDESDKDTYAGGGICHIIADAICDIMWNIGIESTTVSCSYEQHVYVAVKVEEGVYNIDIPYSIYETGGGFNWKKLPDIKFDSRDVVFYKVSSDPEEFDNYTAEGVAEDSNYEREPLYHATLKAFEPSIMKSGLLPGGNLRMFDWSDSKFVYLSNYPDIARDFIDPGVIEPDQEHEAQIFNLMKQGGMILKIDQNKLNRQLLSADPHFNTDADDGAETYIYSGVIPPSAIIGKEYFRINESKQGVAESSFASTMKKAIDAHERGDHKRAKYHLDNAKTARYGLKSTEIGKHKALLDKYKELSDMHKSQGVAESVEQVAISVRKGRNKFATEMTVNGEGEQYLKQSLPLEEGWKDALGNLAIAGAIGAGGAGGLAAKDSFNKWQSTMKGTSTPAATAPAPQQTKQIQAPVSKSAIAQGVQKAQAAKQAQPKVEPEIRKITNSPLEDTLRNVAQRAGLAGTELAAFMAQCAHETLDFQRLKEIGGKLDFRKYDPKHAPKKAQALGNKHAGDGERYKGRGFIQLTGRHNYKKAGQALGLPLEQKPELVEDPTVAAQVAVWFWKHRVQPNVDNFSDVKAVTRMINPGMRGLEDRAENFNDYINKT